MWVCKHGTFSSVVLSNIANAGKCDCGDLHPSISFGKEERSKDKADRIKLTTATVICERQIIFVLPRRSAALLAHSSKMWVMCGREACATQLVLSGGCADTGLTEGEGSSQDGS